MVETWSYQTWRTEAQETVGCDLPHAGLHFPLVGSAVWRGDSVAWPDSQSPGKVWTFVLISWVEVISEPEKASKSNKSAGIDRAQHVTQQCPRAWGEQQKYKNHPSPWWLRGPWPWLVLAGGRASGQSQKFGPPVGTGRPAGGVLVFVCS